MAPAPLTPRHGAGVAWTGSEVIIVGGDTETPCPPGADCAYSPRPSVEVAAYDPDADSWRVLPDLPEAMADARAWWTGEELIVVGSGHTFTLDPATETWQRLATSPEVGDFSVATDDALVFVAYDQRPDERPVDWRFDPDTGRWSALPRDPFGESYDRSMAWDGERLWLLSMAVENHFAAHEGAPSRVAVLEDDRWRVVTEDTPSLTYEQDMWSHDDRLVVPAGSNGGQTRIYDPATASWSALPPVEDPACLAPSAGSGPVWLSGGSALTTADPEDTFALPPCPELGDHYSGGADVAVWAGDALFIWGGNFRKDTTIGMIWTPPN